MDPRIDIRVEEKALRDYGMLGRGRNMGNSLFAISYSALPKEAHDTIFKIANGLPFPYYKDGSRFGNRFGDLPSGEYFEYTVVTPGLGLRNDGKPKRGQRRIVARKNGMLFFTACHYERFNGGASAAKKAAQISKTLQLDSRWRNGFYIITGIDPEMRLKLVSQMHNKAQLHLATP